MRAEDDMPYREGVVLDKPTKAGRGSFVNVGLLGELQIDKKLQSGLRVTVKMGEKTGKNTNHRNREDTNTYYCGVVNFYLG